MTRLAFVAFVALPLLKGCAAIFLPAMSLMVVAVRKGINLATFNLTAVSFTQRLQASASSCSAALTNSVTWLRVHIIATATAATAGLQRLSTGLSQQRADTFRALAYCWALPCLVWPGTITVQNVFWAVSADVCNILQLCHVELAGFFVTGLSSMAQASTYIAQSAWLSILKAVCAELSGKMQLFIGVLPQVCAAVSMIVQSILMAPEASSWSWALRLLVEVTLAFACHKVHISMSLFDRLRLQYTACCELTCSRFLRVLCYAA